MNAMGEPANATDEERLRDAITLAKNMRNNGASLESIESRLANRGFDAQSIQAVLHHVPSEEPDNIIVRPDGQSGGRVFLVVLGLMISALGLFFVFGNKTGLAPSVPFFGFAMMVVGGVIMAAGRS
jgi:hypothetical protein